MAIRLTVRRQARKTNPAVSALALALPNPARSSRPTTDPLGLFSGHSRPRTAAGPRVAAGGHKEMIKLRVSRRRPNRRKAHRAAARIIVAPRKPRRRNKTVSSATFLKAAAAIGITPRVKKSRRGRPRVTSPLFIRVAKPAGKRRGASTVGMARLARLGPRTRARYAARRAAVAAAKRVPNRRHRRRSARLSNRNRLHRYTVRRANRARRYTVRHANYAKRSRKRNRRHNGKSGLSGLFGQAKTWALPVLGGVAGLAGGRWLANLAAAQAGESTAQTTLVGVATDLGLMVAAHYVLPKLKFIPAPVRTGVMIGLGIDAVARVIGALLPDSELRRLLIGGPAGSTGTGQYDVYEAGLLGDGMGSMGGVGNYVSEPTGGGMQGIGSYVQEQLGASVYEAPAGMGMDVYEAPAGVGSYVTEGNSPFDGGSEDFDDDFGLDPAEAAIEGLGAVQNQIEAAGGKLAYASDHGKRILQGKGMRVSPVAKSKRMPGVDIVAVQQSSPAGLLPGHIPSGATGRPFQSIPATVGGNMPRVAGGVFEPLYDV